LTKPATWLLLYVKVFYYIQTHLRFYIVYDNLTHDWSGYDWSSKKDWSQFYPDIIEPVPINISKPFWQAVQINIFCDAAHATDLVTRRSTKSIFLFVDGTSLSNGFLNPKILLNLLISVQSLWHWNCIWT
jgi:hypothetical protein